MRIWFSFWLTTSMLLVACNGGSGGGQQSTLYYEGTPQTVQNPRLPDSLKPDTPPTQQTDYRYVISTDTVLYEAVISNSQRDTAGPNTFQVWVTDSGKTAFFLSPQASQIMRLNLEQLTQQLRAKNPVPTFPYEPTDSSAKVAGYSAQHYRMDSTLPQLNISFNADLWTTGELDIQAPAWMTKFSAFEIVQGQPLFYPNVSGVPVKYTMNIAGRNPQSGQEQTNQVQFELTEAKPGEAPEGAFQLPDLPVKDLPQQQRRRRQAPPPPPQGQQGQSPQRQQPQRQAPPPPPQGQPQPSQP